MKRNLCSTQLCCYSAILFSLTSPSLLWAQQTSPKNQEIELQQTMNKMSEDFFKLRILARSEKEFSDAKNSDEIKMLMASVVRSAQITHKNEKLASGNYIISNDALIEHLQRNEKIFLTGDKNFSRWMVKSTQFVCMSCHTQFPSYGKKFELSKEQKSLFSDFEQAEFLFASRDYVEALKLYEKILGNSQKYEAMDVERSAERIVTYYSRLLRDFQSGLAKLQKIEKEFKAPEYLKAKLKVWIDQFIFLSTLAKFDPKTSSEKQIIDLIEKMKEPVRFKDADNLFAVNQYVAGLLYEYLNSHPATEVTPKIMFELAILDSLLDQNFFFSLGDLYLRNCIVRFPKSKVARQCYTELEERTILSFTGSRGTSVPDDVKSDLKRLKKLLK